MSHLMLAPVCDVVKVSEVVLVGGVERSTVLGGREDGLLLGKLSVEVAHVLLVILKANTKAS